MADEFDLKPTSRGEEFLDVILRSLGGDTPDIPQPAWRYEEYLAAIANAIQNGGGGSSGGGVLMVHETISEGTHALDKTWKQISDAANAGTIIYYIIQSGSDEGTIMCANRIVYDGVAYCADFSKIGGANQYMFFECETENGYPSYTG